MPFTHLIPSKGTCRIWVSSESYNLLRLKRYFVRCGQCGHPGTKSNVAGLLMLARSLVAFGGSAVYPVLVKKEGSLAGLIWNNHRTKLGLPNYVRNILQQLLLQTGAMVLLMLRDAVRSTARTACPGRCSLGHF